MIAGVYKEDMAVATGSEFPLLTSDGEFDCPTHAVTYLFRTTGQVLGVSLSGALVQSVLLHQLKRRITGPGSSDVSGEVDMSGFFCILTPSPLPRS
jgi:hypothetical protein